MAARLSAARTTLQPLVRCTPAISALDSTPLCATACTQPKLAKRDPSHTNLEARLAQGNQAVPDSSRQQQRHHAFFGTARFAPVSDNIAESRCSVYRFYLICCKQWHTFRLDECMNNWPPLPTFPPLGNL